MPDTKIQNLELEKEQEINLRDYVDVIVKRKKLILSIFAITVSIVAIINFSLPKVYEISMVFELGKMGISEKGEMLYLNSVENMVAKIQEGAYTDNIVLKLGLDLHKKAISFKVAQPSLSHLIKVSIEEEGKDVDMGGKVLNQLFEEVHNDNKDVVESKKKVAESQVIVILEAITDQEKTITSHEKKIAELEEQEKGLLGEITTLKSRGDELIGRRDTVLDSKNMPPFNDLAPLIYDNAIQQNTVYINQLDGWLAGLKSDVDKLSIMIEKARAVLINLKLQKAQLERMNDNIHNVKIIKEPTVSLRSVRPKKRQNIIFAGVGSLVFGIFLAFFMELYEPSKK